MRRAGSGQDITPGTVTGIDQPVIAQLPPCLEVKGAPVALQDRTFLPLQSEPSQVFQNRLLEFGPATRTIEIFNPQHQRAAAFPAALLRAPECQRMPRVQVAGRRRREAAPVAFVR